jgi:LysR family transcriptional regulator for metE and metH
MPRLNVEIRDLELVEAVADCRGLAKAATRLHLTPSALSHQLRALEDRLGASLFVRGPRHMIPTPAGERLLRAGLPVLRELRQAENEIGRRDGRSGVLRICAESYASYHWLPLILKHFQQAFPRVDVRVVPEATGQPLEALRDRRLDLAIVYHRPWHDGVRAFPLFRDEMVVLLPEHHVLARRTHVDAEDLAAERVLIVPGEDCDGAIPSIRIPLTDLIVDMVRDDLGVGVMPSWIAARALGSGGLAARRLTRDGTVRDWYAAHLDGDVPGYLSTFVELLFRRPPTVSASFPDRGLVT